MESFYTRIEKIEQIKNLEKLQLKEDFKFFFSLFFNGDKSRDWLLQTGRCVLYCINNVVYCGNIDNITDEYVEKTQVNFIEIITA